MRTLLAALAAAALLRAAAAVPCPCADAAQCGWLADQPAAAPTEVFQFQVTPANWPFYDWSSLTTVALFGGTPPEALAMVCHAHARRVRAVIGAPLDARQLRNATYLAAFEAEVLALVDGSRLGVQLDGVNFDVEDPLAGADAAALTAAVARTAAALKRAMGASFQVSVDVAWSPGCIDGRCYDYAGLAAAADLLFVMAYDMRSQVLPPAPCTASANSPFPGVAQGMLAYEALGIAPSKLVLGLPWYGYRYPCLPGTGAAAAVCPIASVPFRNVSCSDAAGAEVCFADIRALLRNASAPPSRPEAWDPALAAPFFNEQAGPAVTQFWYDDPRSLALKVAYARAQGWRGVGTWNADCLAYNSTLPQEREDTAAMWRALAAIHDAPPAAPPAAPSPPPPPPPPFPRMANFTAAFIARELGHLASGTLNGTAVRDLAAAAWALLALRNASAGALAPGDVSAALRALEAVLGAQLPNGQWPWSFGSDACLDANSVQFTSLPLLLAIVHFGGALGSGTVAAWQPRLQAAAAASYAEGSGPASEAQPYYTNIATMRLVNLHLFAQVTGNATLRAQADAATAAWTGLVDAAGLHEYASPTYSAVTIQNLAAGAAAVGDAALAAQLRRYRDYALAAAAAVLWGPAGDMGGAHSRDYDFMYGSAGMAWVYALTGLSAAAGVAAPDAFALDADPITQAELLADAARGALGRAPAGVLALAAPLTPGAWRSARFSFLPTPGAPAATDGADATFFASATATLGTSSLYYGPQDKMVAAQLALAAGGTPPAASPRLAQVTLVQDAFDAPYGRVETRDGSGHAKPTHLKATVAAVQDGGLALVLNDLTMAIEGTAGGGSFSSLAANVLLPCGRGIDGLYVNGVRLAGAVAAPGAPDVPLALGDTVAVRSRGGIVAARVPFADGLRGFSPRAALRFDGPPGTDAARLVTYLYQGPNASFPADPPPSRSLLLLAVGAAGSDAEAAGFSAALAALVVENAYANASAWRVRVSPAPQPPGDAAAAPLPRGFASTLEAELCVPRTKRILLRAVNGSSLAVPRGGAIEVAWSDGRAVTVTTAGITEH